MWELSTSIFAALLSFLCILLDINFLYSNLLEDCLLKKIMEVLCPYVSLDYVFKKSF